ncbi:MAG: hypothetical protein KAV00_14180, partial [Phycisphaerae bacterium]|nr:hypothetical protein [Phycisphaerae bacterium]
LTGLRSRETPQSQLKRKEEQPQMKEPALKGISTCSIPPKTWYQKILMTREKTAHTLKYYTVIWGILQGHSRRREAVALYGSF